MTTPEGYKIKCNKYFGEGENIVLNMTITFLDGTARTENRFTKANKKNMASTSMYGIKCKVNLNTLEVIQ
jgi:hypothetical protein